MHKIADGETGYKLCTVSILWQYTDPSSAYINSYLETGFLDENVLVGYAERLVPRAVSYSAGLLKYFFRGTLDISLPDSGVYAARDSMPEDPARQGFGTVSLRVKNTTSTGESLLGGKYTLVVQYRLLSDSPDSSDPAAGAKNPFASTSYDYAKFKTTKPLFIVQSLDAQSNHTLATGASTLLTFTLDKEIPLWAADVRFSVVYRGKLGYSLNEPGLEEDAVCTGFLKVSEPTPIDFGNSVDTFCIDDAWYNLLRPADRETIDRAYPSTSGGVGFPCLLDHQPADLEDLYIRFSSVNASAVASPTQYHFHIERIPPGKLKRLFIITDYYFKMSRYSESFAEHVTLYSVKAFHNGISDNNGTLTWFYPTFHQYRKVESWTRFDLKEPCDSCPNLSSCPNCVDANNPFAYEMLP